VAGIALAIVFGAVMLPIVGAAEDVEALLKKGNDLRRQGRDREALVEFQRAARISETPRVDAQVALAEQAIGLWVEAEVHMTKALADRTDPWIAKNRPTLESALSTVRQHLGTVEVWGSPDGAEVLLDGKVVGHLPAAGPISFASTEVVLQVRAPAYVEMERTLRIQIGGVVREHVDLRKKPLSAAQVSAASPADKTGPLITAPTSDEPAGGGRTRLHLAWAASAGAVAVLGGAVAFNVAAVNKSSSFDRSCGLVPGTGQPAHDPAATPLLTDAACRDLFNRSNSERSWARAGYAAGATLGIAAIVLFATSSSGSTVTSNGPRAHLSCSLGSTSIGCGGSF
jgi:hypothetical protein